MTEQVLLFNRQPDRPLSLDEYRAHGGYEALIETVKKLTPEEVRQAVLDSKLRGRGGAWFSTGKKWSFIGKAHPRYVVPNTDEMEPGTYKDRVLVNVNPHLVLEGIILAGFAISAAQGI
ncbi:MAG: NADH-quinone oxidoreductase subunit F, partial [Syntrophobacterales bacterium]